MTPEELTLYNQVIDTMKKQYPNSKITFEDGIVSLMQGIEYNSFNTNGYNFLYCLTALTDALRHKLY